MCKLCAQFLLPFDSWWDAISFGWFVFLGLVLGFFLAIFPGCFVIAPLSYHRELKNGGPFNVGDRVQILVGRHKGRVTSVYALSQGNTVRVTLSELDQATFRDIYSPMQLLREPDVDAPANRN